MDVGLGARQARGVRAGFRAQGKPGLTVRQNGFASSRLAGEKRLGGALQQRLLLREAETAQLAASRDAPAAGRRHRVKGLFLRGHK